MSRRKVEPWIESQKLQTRASESENWKFQLLRTRYFLFLLSHFLLVLSTFAHLHLFNRFSAKKRNV